MVDIPKELIGEFIDAVVQNRDRAKLLLASYPQLIDARWRHNETVLHFLAVEGFADGVTFLAEHGADVNAANEFGDAPLIDVAVLGNPEIAQVLLSHGANPNACSETRNNPLDCAVRSGNVPLVGLLLEAGADGRYVTDLGESVFDALPPLESGRDEILALLAERGMTPNEHGVVSHPGSATAFDRNGRRVEAGMRVRVLQLAEFLKRDLPPEEWTELKTMVGEVFEVYEIDAYGAAWVEKSWHEADGQSHSHSLALESREMEIVEDPVE